MEGGPLQSALLAPQGSRDVKTETINEEQIRQLLIFMGTITIISFVLVITLITIFIAFIWYNRTRLHKPCGYTHDHDKQRQEARPHQHQSVPLPAPLGQPVKMFVVHPRQFQSRSCHKNVIVNPLPSRAVSVSERDSLGRGELGSKDLLPPVNQSPRLVAETSYLAQDELDQMETGQDDFNLCTEPIYTEILPRDNIEKVNKILEEEDVEKNVNKKKEVEYWQITAKEVVKFRPCTETFIQRE